VGCVNGGSGGMMDINERSEKSGQEKYRWSLTRVSEGVIINTISSSFFIVVTTLMLIFQRIFSFSIIIANILEIICIIAITIMVTTLVIGTLIYFSMRRSFQSMVTSMINFMDAKGIKIDPSTLNKAQENSIPIKDRH
jgi:hypothetical protein